jgi:hypothetical protein
VEALRAAHGHAAQPVAHIHALPAHYPLPPAPAYDPQPVADLRGGHYDHGGAVAPQSLDLSHYGHADPRALPVGETPQGWPAMPPQLQPAVGGYAAQPGHPAPLADPTLGADPRYGRPEGALAPQPELDDDELEVAERPSRYRKLMIVGVLVGAIALGGGLAYGYKLLMGPARKDEAPKVVKAPTQPARTPQGEQAAKRIASTDNKVMDRLPTEGSTSRVAGSEADGSGVRRVPIIPVGRDGSIGAPPPPAPVPSATPVPGLTVVDGGVAMPSAVLPAPRSAAAPLPPAPPAIPQVHPGVRPQPQLPPPVAAAPAAPPPAAAPAAAVTPPVRPKVIARVEPAAAPPASEPAPAPAAQPVPQRPKIKAAAAPAPAAEAPPPAAVGAAPAAAPKRTGAGWVAVVSSQKSRMDALKAFADLQQRYAGVLGSKVPDVQEADLSSRGLGTVYRLLVGPPGSREAALDVCNQLKAQGHKDCWALAY